jgi:hypothetical protein
MKIRTLLLPGLVALSTSLTQAALLTYESFDYSAGNVHTQNGGTGWGAAWDTQQSNTNYQVATTSPLTYGTLTTGGNYLTGGGGFDRTGRRLDTGFGSVWDTSGRVSDPFGSGGFGQQLDQGTVWASFLVRRNVATASWDGLDIRFHNSSIAWNANDANSSLTVSYDATNSNWQASSINNGNSAALANSALGNTMLIVVKFELSLTAGQNNIYLWQDPGTLGGTDLSVSSAAWSATGLNTADARFRSLSFYSGSAGGATSLDEIRFGTSYADVTPGAIPEPSAFAALAGLAALGLTATRRRRVTQTTL